MLQYAHGKRPTFVSCGRALLLGLEVTIIALGDAGRRSISFSQKSFWGRAYRRGENKNSMHPPEQFERHVIPDVEVIFAAYMITINA